MLRKDFIMVQIEELGKVIAQIISNRNTNAARKNQELVQVVYTSLRLEPEDLLRKNVSDIHEYLNGDDSCGLQRMEIAAKLLIEESIMYPEKKVVLCNKARELLEYIQQHDNTFSLERLQLISDLDQALMYE